MRAVNGACHESRLGAWEVLWEDTGELQLAELLGQLGHSRAVLSLVVLEGEGEGKTEMIGAMHCGVNLIWLFPIELQVYVCTVVL